jgi:ankyrin repeat protein
LNSGVFIDQADFSTIESLFTQAPLDEVKQHIADNTCPENLLPQGQQPMALATLAEKQEAYDLALASSQYRFFPYSHPELDRLLQGELRLQSLPCSQKTLVHFIENRENILTPEREEELGVLCAKFGYAKALTALIEARGLSPDHIDSQESEPLLHLASASDHTQAVLALIKKGAAINAVGPAGYTALILAAANGQTDIALALIAADADVDAVEENGVKAWALAAIRGYTEIALALIKKGVAINAVDQNGQTALMFAAKTGHTALALAVIAADADVNVVDPAGYTALILAAAIGHTDIALALIAADADVNAVEEYGRTALMLAAGNGHTDIALALIAADANVDAVEGNGVKAWALAAFKGHTEIALALIEKSANVDVVDPAGYTALILAAANGHTELALALIAKGANVDVVDTAGQTALIWAAANGHTELALSLIAKGANVDVVDIKGWTALIWAARNGHTQIALALIEKGAGVDLNKYPELKDSLTVQSLQSQSGLPKIMDVLMKQERTQMSQASIKACFGKLFFFYKIQYALGELNFQEDNERIIDSFLNGEKNYLPCTIEELKEELQTRDTLTIKQVDLVKPYLLACGEKSFCECLDLKMNKNNLSVRDVVMKRRLR